MPYMVTIWGDKHDVFSCETREEAKQYVVDSNVRNGRPADSTSTLSIIEIDAIKPCVFCGGHITSTNPECDFCRSCYQAGRADERSYGDLLERLKTLPNVKPDSVGIWNSGGGCMILSASLLDGRYLQATAAYHDEETDEWHVSGGLPSKDKPWGMFLARSMTEMDDEANWMPQGDCPVKEVCPLDDDEFVKYVRNLGVLVAP